MHESYCNPSRLQPRSSALPPRCTPQPTSLDADRSYTPPWRFPGFPTYTTRKSTSPLVSSPLLHPRSPLLDLLKNWHPTLVLYPSSALDRSGIPPWLTRGSGAYTSSTSTANHLLPSHSSPPRVDYPSSAPCRSGIRPWPNSDSAAYTWNMSTTSPLSTRFLQPKMRHRFRSRGAM